MTHSMTEKILVTGASGFVGSNIVKTLKNYGHQVVGVSRSSHESTDVIRRIDGDTDWSDILHGVDVVIHCAAKVHEMEPNEESEAEYYSVNFRGTLNLAEQAKNRVKRFIFLSTIKVNGEETDANKFFANDTPNPEGGYSSSKALAEKGLKEIMQSSQMEVVIIRPPLIYGPNPKGNLGILSKLIRARLPLPLIDFNARSLVYLGNLVEFTRLCIEHPGAANETFLVSDDDDLSTSGLAERIGNALGVRIIEIPIPMKLLEFIFLLVGKKQYGARLFGNLRIDVRKKRQLLNWKPKYTVQEGFDHSFRN